MGVAAVILSQMPSPIGNLRPANTLSVFIGAAAANAKAARALLHHT
jgi:hypothetical protein